LLERIEAGLPTGRHVRCTVQRPKDRRSFPVLEVYLDEDGLGRTAFDVLNALRRGSPPVYLSEKRAHEGVLLVHPVSLDQRGADVVVERLRQVLG
ncbi:MAG TPA: selenocysteine synthase, partial [Chloroflexota bacterium]